MKIVQYRPLEELYAQLERPSHTREAQHCFSRYFTSTKYKPDRSGRIQNSPSHYHGNQQWSLVMRGYDGYPYERYRSQTIDIFFSLTIECFISGLSKLSGPLINL